MKLRLALGASGLSLLLACGGPMMVAPKTHSLGDGAHSKNLTTGGGCDETTIALSLVWMDESKREELERQLEDGLVFVSMPTCGEIEPVKDCHVAADYKLSSGEMSTAIDTVRSERDAAVFAFRKEGLSAFPSGYDVATRTATFLLDGKSLGGAPTGSGCGQATHVVTAGLVGAFRVAAQGAAEFPNVANKEDEKGVRKAGDPVVCKNEGVRSKECRALVAVNLRALNGSGRGTKAPSEHEQTGIIAPH